MLIRRRLWLRLAILIVISLVSIPLLLYHLDDGHSKNFVHRKADSLKGLKKMMRYISVVTADVQQIQGSESHETNKDSVKTVLKRGYLGNFEPVEVKPSSLPGENGEPVYTSMTEKSEADASVHEYGFNMVASNKISLTRTIPDTRMNECKYWHYPQKLPTASVIVVFHNEGWSTLLRTIHSIINTSPAHLLKEVIMVDDMSTKPHLQGKLDKYIKKLGNKVKLYRNSQREGLIRTRTRGAEYAVGDVIVFLDAHCECNRNWLVPLLARIAYDRTIMAVPIVESIDWDNFRYQPVYSTNHHRGIFEWGFLYKESLVPEKELAKRKHHSEPYWSPTHAGGLFAMDRNYFFELGGYDPGLQIWGGENFELSFKIWMCGGSIEWVPCSRVGHVYRNYMPYGFGKITSKIPVVLLNYMRVVEVWLDEDFKQYFYRREPAVEGYPVVNITDQLAFKRGNKCKSFSWFMDNIAYDVYDKFPPPPENKAWGEIASLSESNLCWDTYGQPPGGSAIGLRSCHHFGGNQLFRLNVQGQLATGERCIDSDNLDTMTVYFCAVQPTGPWSWNETTGQIRNKGLCVEYSTDNLLHLKKCDSQQIKQQWVIKNVWSWK
ncbi:N-acetylgalactosaminyltransferase 7-like [Argonauta hians]